MPRRESADNFASLMEVNANIPEDQEVVSLTRKCGINEGLLVRNGLLPFFKGEIFLEGKSHHVSEILI